MSLDPLHEQIARIAFALPEAGQVALAGGGAMLAHDLVDRLTQDVDLFTPDPADVTRLADALAVALRAEGARVKVDRRGPGFTRLAVTVADGRSVVVEIAHDARIREAMQLSFGRVLHPDEVAADKDSRAVRPCSRPRPSGFGGPVWAVHAGAAVRASREKDPGFDRRVFADALAAAAAHSDAAFAELGLRSETLAILRVDAARWRAQLLNAADMSATDTGRFFAGRTPPASEAPGSPSPSRSSERHRPPRSSAGRDGPSPSR